MVIYVKIYFISIFSFFSGYIIWFYKRRWFYPYRSFIQSRWWRHKL